MQDRQLLIFSVIFTLWAVASMAIPYMRGKADLLSARNFFTFGAVMYVGFSGIKAATEGHFFPYGRKVFLLYYFYIIVFFVVFEFAYRKIKWPRRAAARRYLQWPQQDGLGLWFPMALTFIAMVGQLIIIQAPGLKVIARSMGLIAPAFAFAFALSIWRRNKSNPVSLALVGIVFFIGAYLGFSGGGGRRFLYAVAVAVPVCYYWWTLRYKRPMVTMSIFACFLVLWPIGDSAYRAARWYGYFGASKSQQVGAAQRWKVFRDSLLSKNESMTESTLQIGQTTVENSLLMIYIFNEAKASFPKFSVKPLHSVYVILTLPIPRALWEGKPTAIGITMPYDSGVLHRETAQTNWGPGLVGHSVHDGGILAAIFYALAFGMALRFVDEILVRHPGNPFLMGFLSGASVQIAALVRGDFSNMATMALLCFAFMTALAWATKMIVGVESPWAQAATGQPAPQYGGQRAYQ
jgi:hypothetical protein